jgi:hypothetical protein
VVYDSGDAIHILERKGNQVFATSHPYGSTSMLERGSILLVSWLTFSSITDSGEAGSITLDFNTSGARHFALFMDKLRPSTHAVGGSQLSTEKDKFDYLSPLNYKLMNFGRNSLMAGENVRQIVLQAEIKEALWPALGGTFQKLITPAHLTILTDCELILIQEVPPATRKQKDNYGGIWQYIRLDGIRSAECKESEGRLIFSVTVSPDKKIEKIFAKENQELVERLCADLNLDR